MKYNLVVCMIFRDEACNLVEWLEYHRMLGVEHFYLYSHMSEDNFLEVLDPYTSAGLVTLVEWNFPRAGPSVGRGPFPQVAAYDHAISTQRGVARWSAFIDCDEFIAQMSEEPISAMLARCDGAAGILLNWCTFGASGYATTPEGLVLENYCKRASIDYGLHHHVKSIVSPEKVWTAHDPHQFLRINPHDTYVDSSGAVLSPFSGADIRFAKTDHVKWDRFRVNHYAIKSRQHVTWKLKVRGRMSTGQIDDEKHIDEYFTHHDRNDVYDDHMLQYVPELKRRVSKLEVSLNEGVI
jgi:hypothetical protein